MFFHFVVLGWQNNCESVDVITETLAALSTEIDISVIYHGLDRKSIYCLVSVVRLLKSFSVQLLFSIFCFCGHSCFTL